MTAQSTRVDARRDEFLVSLIYFQAFLLALTYAVGVWQALFLLPSSITAPILVLHGFLAGSYALVTGSVGLLSRLREVKSAYYLNMGLFLATILGGSVCWIYLGNQNTQLLELLNSVMTTTVGLGLPITAFTLASLSGVLGRSKEPRFGRRLMFVYIALISTSMHLFMGVSTIYEGLGTTYYAHMILGLVTGASLLIAFAFSASRGYREKTGITLTNSFVLILAIVFAVISGLSGILFLSGGSFNYVILMAESSMLVYAFALASIEKR